MSMNMGGGAKKLSSKNLQILEDELNHEALLVHKYEQASTQCTDPQLRQLCTSIAEKHHNHFTTLLDYLNSHQ